MQRVRAGGVRAGGTCRRPKYSTKFNIIVQLKKITALNVQNGICLRAHTIRTLREYVGGGSGTCMGSCGRDFAVLSPSSRCPELTL